MPSSLDQSTLSVALIGNPNTGKSTVFGALAGVRQRVGNYPGVTVEKKTGQMQHEGTRYELVDLPGLYSLAPRSPDEMVAVDVLLGRFAGSQPVNAVICIVDASNLRRNLYLVSQILELGLPTVVALNMFDVARRHGVSIDVGKLQERLGVPVVAMQANRAVGVPELKAALAEVGNREPQQRAGPMPEPFQREVARLQTLLADREPARSLPRYLVERLLLDFNGYLKGVLLPETSDEITDAINAARTRLAKADCEAREVETTARYDWIQRVLETAVSQPGEYGFSASDHIDRVLTHRLWGTIIFAAVMVVLFQSVFTWAEPFMNWINAGVGWLGDWVGAGMTTWGIGGGALESLAVKGVIGGVGGVAVFLPQILILFLFIAILEDCGYMARAAYLMDKMMVRVGLSGKSFIPMVSSFACAIPGIMAARVIEDERDRLTTILVAPLLTCSARLPVFAMLIAAFIPEDVWFGLFGVRLLSLQGLTLVSMYMLGIVTAVVVALLLKKTILKSRTPPFVMELPSYKWPSPRNVFHRVAERGWLFVRCAGTMILAVSIIVWAALYYPHDAGVIEAQPEVQRLRAELGSLGSGDPQHETLVVQLDREVAGAYQRESVLGRTGRLLEPVFRPLGWDWRIGCAVIASFPAREVVVATLGVIYNLGEDLDVESEEGFNKLRVRLDQVTWDGTDEKVFNTPVALSIMVFFALCAQCAATLAVIRRETNSWRWPLFTFAYMTVLAYLGAMVTYHVGMWIIA